MNKSIIYPILAPHTNCLRKTLIMYYYVAYCGGGGGGSELPGIRNNRVELLKLQYEYCTLITPMLVWVSYFYRW